MSVLATGHAGKHKRRRSFGGLPDKMGAISPWRRVVPVVQQANYEQMEQAVYADKILLEMLRKKLKRYPWDERWELTRYLISADWVVSVAFRFLTKHLQWWSETRPDRKTDVNLSESEWHTVGVARFIGPDRDGRSSGILYPALHNKENVPVTIHLDMLVWAMERALKTNKNTSCWGEVSVIVDYAGLSMRKHFDKAFFLKAAKLLRRHYTGCAGHVVIIDCPKIWQNALNFIFVTNGSRSRGKEVHTSWKRSTEVLLQHFPTHSIPCEYGGTLNCLTETQRALLYSCGRIKFGKEGHGGIPLGVRPLLTPANDPKPLRWTCPMCNKINRMSTLSCRSCCAKKPSYELLPSVDVASSIRTKYASAPSISMENLKQRLALAQSDRGGDPIELSDGSVALGRGRSSPRTSVEHLAAVFEKNVNVHSSPMAELVAACVREDTPYPWGGLFNESSVKVIVQKAIVSSVHTNQRMYPAAWNRMLATVRLVRIARAGKSSTTVLRIKRAMQAVAAISSTSKGSRGVLNVFGAWVQLDEKIPRLSQSRRRQGDNVDYAGTVCVLSESVQCTFHDWLQGRLSADGCPPSWAARLHCACDVAEGVLFLHTRETALVHGSLSSFSAFVMKDASSPFGVRAVVSYGLDFLLSDISPDVDEHFLRWLPSEAVEAGSFTKATDSFAMGMILLECVSGKIPFHDRPHYADALAAILLGEKISIPAVNKKMARLIKRCISRDPGKRPPMTSIVSTLRKIDAFADPPAAISFDLDSMKGVALEGEAKCKSHKSTRNVSGSVEYVNAELLTSSSKESSSTDVADDEGALSKDVADNTQLKLANSVTSYGVRVLEPHDVTRLGCIGSGSFGVVFQGIYKGLPCAIKTLRHVDDENTYLFDHEAAMMAKVSAHPNIISLYGVLRAGESPSLITAFADKGSLEALLQLHREEGVHLSLSRQVEIATQAASAILFLHAESVIHRDIAARNVLLTGPNYDVLVTDFGMARLKDVAVVTGKTRSMVGPVKYMAPESIKNQEYSTKTDVWSFGVLLWELFTYLVPWEDHKGGILDVGMVATDVHDTILRRRAAVQVAYERRVLPLEAIRNRRIRELVRSCWVYGSDSRASMEEVHACLAGYFCT